MSELIENTENSSREEMARLASIGKKLEGLLLETLAVMLRVDPDGPPYIDDSFAGDFSDLDAAASALYLTTVRIRNMFVDRCLPRELQADITKMLALDCTSENTDAMVWSCQEQRIFEAARWVCHHIVALCDLSTKATELLANPEFSNTEVSFDDAACFIMDYCDELMPRE